jgi:hypothetical protein
MIAACNRGMVATSCNPYGVDLAPGALGDDAALHLVANVFDVPYYRPGTLYLDRLAEDLSCTLCDRALLWNLRLVLVVRAGGDPLTPTSPPASLDAYGKTLGAFLDRYPKAIAAVVIEDEADTGARWSGSVADYLAELAAGCQVAHERGVRCAGSGVSSTSVLFLLAGYYQTHGNTAEAIRILQTAEGNPDVPAVFTSGAPTEQDVLDLLAANQDRLDRTGQLLAGYGGAGADWVNFHWYESNEITLGAVVPLLRLVSGCVGVISDAIGQRDDDPLETTHKLMDLAEMGVRLVVWASADAGSAGSLVDATGALRPTGQALVDASATVDCE